MHSVTGPGPATLADFDCSSRSGGEGLAQRGDARVVEPEVADRAQLGLVTILVLRAEHGPTGLADVPAGMLVGHDRGGIRAVRRERVEGPLRSAIRHRCLCV